MPGVAAIGVRQRFTPLSAKMNWSHPLTHRILFCGVPHLGVEYAKSRPATNGPLATEQGASAFGTAMYGLWTNAATTDLQFLSGAFTVAQAYTNKDFTNSYTRCFTRFTYTSETANDGWELRHGQSGFPQTCMFRNNGSSAYLLQGATTLDHGILILTSTGASRSLYVNALVSSTSTTGNLNPVATTANTSVNWSGTGKLPGSIACAWDRVLSAGEIAMFVADPFCMLSY